MTSYSDCKNLEKKKVCFSHYWARRRVGKTRLIQEITRNEKNALYLFAGEKRAEVLLEAWSFEIGLEILFKSWQAFFRYVLKNYDVVIIDEFQNLARLGVGIISDLQREVDDGFSSTLIVLGSYVGMMHRIFAERNAPLFGRATEMWNIEPLKIEDVLNGAS